VHIDWSTLITVAVVAAAAAIAVVLLISLAIVNTSVRAGRRSDGSAGTLSDIGPAGVLCVLGAGLLVCYGVYLIVS
jgi:hypothetical protein